MTGLLLGAGVYLIRPANEGPREGYAFWAFLVFLIGLAGLLVLVFLLDRLRPRRQPIARAMSLARAGRVDAAVSLLQRQIELRGRSPGRCGALGDCYLLRYDWREAYIQFLEAEQLDGRCGRYLAKQGFALWKLGRELEALELLERAAQIAPKDPSPAWTACHILADLGQFEAARERLEQAERLIEASIPPGTARRRMLEASLDDCRKRLSPTAEGPNNSTLNVS